METAAYLIDSEDKLYQEFYNCQHSNIEINKKGWHAVEEIVTCNYVLITGLYDEINDHNNELHEREIEKFMLMRYTYNKPVKVHEIFIQLAKQCADLRVKDLNYEILGLVLLELYFKLIPRKFYKQSKGALVPYFSCNDIYSYPNQKTALEKYREEDDHPLLYKTHNKSLTGMLLFLSGHLQHTMISGERFITERPSDCSVRLSSFLADDKLLTYENLLQLIDSGRLVLSTPNYYHLNTGKTKNIFTSCYILDIITNTKSNLLEDEHVKKMLDVIKAIQSYQGGIGIYLKVSQGHTELINHIIQNSYKFKSIAKNRSSTIALNIALDDPFSRVAINMRHSTEMKTINRVLFPAILIPDEFMYRVHSNSVWRFFPVDITFQTATLRKRYQEVFQSLTDEEREIVKTWKESTSLSDVYGDEYSLLYNIYEKLNLYTFSIDAKKLLNSMASAALTTGTPFMVFSDNINATDLGMAKTKINGTNLCTEIIQPTINGVTCCCLASINLREHLVPTFKMPEDEESQMFSKMFDIEKLQQTVEYAVYSLNKLIDTGDYPHEILREANLKQRPLAIGIQGYANSLIQCGLKYPNTDILFDLTTFINRVARQASANYSEKYNIEPIIITPYVKLLQKQKELFLKKSNIIGNISKYPMIDKIIPDDPNDIHLKGINTYFTGLMPTSIAATINSNVESFEAPTNSIYTLQLTSQDLIIGYPEILQHTYDGIPSLDITKQKAKPDFVKYASELSHEEKINVLATLSCTIDQSSSYNIYTQYNDIKEVVKFWEEAWLVGAKTTYYVRFHKTLTGLQEFSRFSSRACDISCTSCDA